MSNEQLKNIIITTINNWFSLRKTMYFILIKDIFYCEKQKKIMIKYQCPNKRLGDTIPMDTYMQSALKHATHPDQLVELGMKIEKILNLLTQSTIRADLQEELQRFKKVYYHGK